MIFRFGHFELDTSRAELRFSDGTPVPLERQVYKLLVLLVSNGDRLTTRDEIVSAVWDGRDISDAAIDSRISSLRSALGDTGRTQALLRTVHGQGFRFVAPVTYASSARPGETGHPDAARSGQPSIAILPFRAIGPAPELSLLADALPHELILHLSRLHWLLVIAQGSTFRFRNTPEAGQIGDALAVRYVLYGAVEQTGAGHAVSIQLVDNQRGQVVWADRYDLAPDDLIGSQDRIARAIATELDTQIPVNEALSAQGVGTEHLDAWSSYHLGLHHMFRFTARDNAQAESHFRRALALDPGFARACAGISFTRFQDAFTFYREDRGAATRDARRFAEQAIERDARDPFSNFVLGRYYWLTDDLDPALSISNVPWR